MASHSQTRVTGVYLQNTHVLGLDLADGGVERLIEIMMTHFSAFQVAPAEEKLAAVAKQKDNFELPSDVEVTDPTNGLMSENRFNLPSPATDQEPKENRGTTRKRS